MKLKQRPGDFRVRELLEPDYLLPHGRRGAHAVYRVLKQKRTSFEAAQAIARASGVPPADVSMAGLKDRQGITVQHMSLAGGRPLSIQDGALKIEFVGYADEPLTAEHSDGNAFELVVRGLDSRDLALLRGNLTQVREHGLPNYFDDQRFRNLETGQGWIAKDLMLGRAEGALRRLLATPTRGDGDRVQGLKAALDDNWGDWRACRDIAGKLGAHHSIFEHLAREPGDFGGAWGHVATRLRLIHLYAFQSYLWNRAVTDWMRERVPAERRVILRGVEGPRVAYADHAPGDAPASFRLPGPGLDDVEDEGQRTLLVDALAREGMVPDDFRLHGVPLQIKGEDRMLLLTPRHLRVRPAESDPLNRRARLVRLRFDLPRGAYATLVVERLLAPPGDEPRRSRRVHEPGGARRSASGLGRGDRDPRRDAYRDGGRPERGSDQVTRYHGDREREQDERRGAFDGVRGGHRGGGPGARAGGYRGRDEREERPRGYGGGSGARPGGYRGRDAGDERRGGYGGGQGARPGGYRGRDERDERRGGYGGGQGARPGGYRGRDERDERRGGYGGGQGARPGGYRGRDERDERRGGYGGGQGARAGGYRGRDERDERRGGYGGGQGARAGGYRGRDERDERRGGPGGGQGARAGGYRGRDERDERRGGPGGGQGARPGGYRGRDERDERRGGPGGGQGARAGGYRGRDERDERRGGHGGGQGARPGGYRGRDAGDERRGGYGGGQGARPGGYRGRDAGGERRGGPGGGQGARAGGYRGRDERDERRGGPGGGQGARPGGYRGRDAGDERRGSGGGQWGRPGGYRGRDERGGGPGGRSARPGSGYREGQEGRERGSSGGERDGRRGGFGKNRGGERTGGGGDRYSSPRSAGGHRKPRWADESGDDARRAPEE